MRTSLKPLALRGSTLCVLLALATVPLLGCALFGPSLEPPEVLLIGLEPLPGAEGGTLEQRFQVQLRILNPNDRSLEIDGVDFTLNVNGRRLARGLGDRHVTVPRLGEGVVHVTASTTLVDWVRQLVGLTTATSLRYEIHGRVFLAGSFRGLAFSSAGEIASPRAQEGV